MPVAAQMDRPGATISHSQLPGSEDHRFLDVCSDGTRQL